MKVADETSSKLVVEVQTHALHKVKDQILQVINLRNVRGITQFLGLGEEKPFNVPSREALAPRARKNVLFFSTNYAISAALVGVVTMYVLIACFFVCVWFSMDAGRLLILLATDGRLWTRVTLSLIYVMYSLLNPMFLFVLICVAGFWLYASSAAANETAENPMLVLGRPITPEQRKLGLTGSTSP